MAKNSYNEDINKWIEIHKDKIENTAEVLVVENILAEKIKEMKEKERRNALNIDPREDIRLNYFKGLQIKPHSKEILYPTRILKLKNKNQKIEVENIFKDEHSVWFSNKANGPDFNDKDQKWLHDIAETNSINKKKYKPLPIGQEPIRNDVLVKIDQIYDEQLAYNDRLYTNKLDSSSYKQLPKAASAPKYEWNPEIEEEQNNDIPKKNNFFNELVLKLSKVKYAPITATGAGSQEIDQDDIGINLGETSDYSVTQKSMMAIIAIIVVIVLYKVFKN